MAITGVNKVGLASIIGGGLVAAVMGFAGPAQAAVGHAPQLGTPHAQVTLASIVGPGPDPLVPYGTNPQVKTPIGLQTSNHDEIDTTNGLVDLPF